MKNSPIKTHCLKSLEKNKGPNEFFYAGIGARKTPQDILMKMTQIGAFFSSKGWCLRSGGAMGADSAFEVGCDKESGKKQIFLPWDNFNGNQSMLYPNNMCKIAEAEKIAKDFHPYWNNLSDVAKLFMTRNTFQVLGCNLESPSDFLVCWTPNGEDVGGTAQAIRIARSWSIKVYNLFFEDSLVELREYAKNR